ncbi:MAG: hypothetical protein AAFV29_17140, partial [Myxococcota bacterium]
GTWLSEHNPWWPHIRRFSDYASRLTTVLSESENLASLAILAPQADEWSRHALYQPFPEESAPWYQYALPAALASAGYGPDYVSDSILQAATATEGMLRFGPRKWTGLLVLGAKTIEPQTMQAILRFAQKGGRVLFVDRMPVRAPGLHNATTKDARVQKLASLLRSAPQNRVAVVPGPPGGPPGNFELLRAELPTYARRGLLQWVLTRLPAFGLTPSVQIDAPHFAVEQIHHRQGHRPIVFFANSSKTDAVTLRAQWFERGHRPWRWDPETGDRAPIPADKHGRIWLRLEPVSSQLIVFEPPAKVNPSDLEPTTTPRSPFASASQWKKLPGPWRTQFRHAYSKKIFSRTMSLKDLSLSARPEEATFAGKVTYRLRFKLPDTRYDHLDLGTIHGDSVVELNGKALGVRWYGRHEYPISHAIKKGWNRLKITVNVVAANYARSLRNNKAAQVWSFWYPPIPTGLVGPVRLLKKAPEEN